MIVNPITATQLAIVKLVVILLAVAGILGYTFHLGFQRAETKYTKIIKEYEDNINVKIDNIETLASTLSKDLKNTEVTISKDLKTIIVNGRKSPPTIIVDGKCMPSEEYKASIKALHKKANEALK